MFCMSYAFFWVIPRHLEFICWRFQTLCLFHLHRQVDVTCLWRWNRQSVPKRRHINSRRWGITQKKAHNMFQSFTLPLGRKMDDWNMSYRNNNTRMYNVQVLCYICNGLLLINPLNAELNPICHLLALLGSHHILHVSRIRVNYSTTVWCCPTSLYNHINNTWWRSELRRGTICVTLISVYIYIYIYKTKNQN